MSIKSIAIHYGTHGLSLRRAVPDLAQWCRQIPSGIHPLLSEARGSSQDQEEDRTARGVADLRRDASLPPSCRDRQISGGHHSGCSAPPAYSSQECALCTFISPDNRSTQAEFVCQRCGHTDNADHNAAVVIAKRGITTLLSGTPLTKTHKRTRIFRQLGPEWSEVTPGKISVRRSSPTARAQRSAKQELPGVIPETHASTRQG